MEKFLRKNFWERLNPEASLLRCIDPECRLELSYPHNFYDNFRCYCRGTARRFEHYAFKSLQEKMPPTAILTKEFLTPAGHKVDIHIKTETAEYFIEIDDESHFSRGTAPPPRDEHQHEWFSEAQFDHPAVFVRIPNACVYNPIVYETIASHFEAEDPEKFLLFRLGNVNRYRHLDFPAGCKITHAPKVEL